MGLSKRAMNLLTNLLDWSRAQTGNIEFNPEYFELVTVINEVLALYNDSAEQKSICISKKLPHDIPVVADKAMVKTILRNLISNAIKFTNPGGDIVIEAEQKAKGLIISVVDTGLGLLLCKEFVEMHGGEIWVESNEAEGCIFNFSLPY